MSSNQAFRAAGRGHVLLLVASLTAAAWTFQAAAGAAATDPDPVAAARESLLLAEAKFGVKFLSVRTSAEGHLVDVRYRVLDAGKAFPLFERGLQPTLIDEASGRMLSVPSTPKTGPLRSAGSPTERRNYFLLFGNSGGAVRCGNRVTLLLGDLEARGLVVE